MFQVGDRVRHIAGYNGDFKEWTGTVEYVQLPGVYSVRSIDYPGMSPKDKAAHPNGFLFSVNEEGLERLGGAS